MRPIVRLCLLIAAPVVLALPQALAQSGVQSGPPQAFKDGAPPGDDKRPLDDKRFDDRRPGPPGVGPGPGPGPRSQNEPPGRRDGPGPGPGPGLRSQDEPPGRRDYGDRDRDRDRRSSWIAVAGGFDGRGTNVGVGYSGLLTNRLDAEDEALRACNRYGRGVSCREPFAVSTGCIYIVPGNKRGGVTWGRGSTRELALEQCRRGGYRCESSRIIGGCVP